VVGVTVWVPLVGSDPIQLPEALQDVAFGADHVNLALCPTGIISLSKDISTNTPVPNRVTETLPEALVSILSAADRVPAAAGVNVTLIVQVPFTPTLPQELTSPNDEAAEPEIVTPSTDNGAVPVLITAMVCGALTVDTN
jgi:hypothetical protein